MYLATGAGGEVMIWRRESLGNTERVTWIHYLSLPIPQVDSPPEDEVVIVSLHWQSQPDNHRNNECEGQLLVSYLWQGIICWDLKTKTNLWKIPQTACISSALSPDNCLIAIYKLSHHFEIYNLRTKLHMQTMRSPIEASHQQLPVVFAHNGLALVGGSVQGRVRVWDVTSGERLQVLVHDDLNPVRAIAAYYNREQDNFFIITAASQQSNSKIFLWETGARRDQEYALHVAAISITIMAAAVWWHDM
ncbi:hypothetical protein DENSPDRAFT_846952 [Dentipellis sp. KUC8613]|nr:hypothetical protein DENSPDRAFT_846952 [Dentipellis sp. KUC8613]